jgi:hypothetical protein
VFAAPLPGRSRRRFAGRAGADRRPGAGQRPPGSAGPVHGGAVRQECPTLRSLVEEKFWRICVAIRGLSGDFRGVSRQPPEAAVTRIRHTAG